MASLPAAATAAALLIGASATSAPVSVVLSSAKVGKRFDGVGGVSGGGGGTRLLLDYAQPERDAILDFLFKPGFGAALQVLKVEVACDGDTTQGSEQSHMRTADDLSPTAFDRGYENWLMVEAKKRNPDIHLSGLEWGVPGWVAEGTPVSGWQPENQGLVAAPTSDPDLASTDECSASEEVQQWTFDAKSIPGQLCNALDQCLNIPACQEGREIILFGADLPHTGSCVARCGCTPEPSKSCGIGPDDLACIKNVQFNVTVAGSTPYSTIQNAISGKFVQEDPDRETLVLKASTAGDGALWQWDAKTKLLQNKASGRCLGRWQNAPPSPPPGPSPPGPSPPPHRQTTATVENIDYLVKWVQGLKEKKNLTIGSLGVGYNEGGFSVPWIKAAKKAFVKAGLSSMLTIGTDDCCGGEYSVASQMMTDPELNASIDILGAHCTGVQNGQKNPSADVLALNKPLWNTEQHFGLPDPSPALCWQWSAAMDLAQTLNQQYIVSNQTSVQMWTPIYSWYEWLPYEGKGLMVANRPWDGTYNVTDTIWVTAHTTQFTARGWHYLDASSLLPEAVSSQGKTGGSFVALASPGCLATDSVGSGGCDFSVIIETVGASAPTTIEFQLTGSLKASALNCVTTSAGAVFVEQPKVAVSPAGMVTVTVPVDSVWTLSTLAGAKGGGGGAGKDQPQKPFPLPYTDDFERYEMDTLPLYFSDMHGAFAIASDSTAAADTNKVLRQQSDALAPLATHGRSAAGYAVAIGDRSWQSYTLSFRVMLELPADKSTSADGFFYLSSHTTTGRAAPETSYHAPYLPTGGGAVMKVSLDGSWSIMSSCGASSTHQCSAAPATVASGSGLLVSNGEWMDVSFALTPGAAGLKIVAVVGGSTLLDETVACRECHFGGPSYLGTGFHHASFDNFTVTPNDVQLQVV